MRNMLLVYYYHQSIFKFSVFDIFDYIVNAKKIPCEKISSQYIRHFLK